MNGHNHVQCRISALHGLAIAIAAMLLAPVALAQSHDDHGARHQDQKAPTKSEQAISDPYMLGTCPVSGRELGSMGDPVVKEYDGREVRFCCSGCIDKFEASKEEYFAKIDKKMIEQQLPYYPMDTCVVMGDPLTDEDGKDIAVNYIYGNRLVRFCCKMCVDDFNESPKKFLKKLDKAAIEQQREHYPLDVCIVSGQSLGSMGKPVDAVYGNRLVRFCCGGCVDKFESNAPAYMKRLDTAWKEHGHMQGHHGDDDHGAHEGRDDHHGHGDAGHGRHHGNDDDHSGHDHDG